MQDRDTIMKEIGRRFRVAREAQYPLKSQSIVASQIGVSLRQYQRWEKGDSLPDWDRLLEVAQELGVNVSDLITGPIDGVSGIRSDESLTQIVSLLEKIVEKLDQKADRPF